MRNRGIEATAHSNGQISHNQVALGLMFGFLFMLVVEQFSSHPAEKHSGPPKPQTIFQLTPGEEEAMEYDLDDMGISESSREDSSRNTSQGSGYKSVFTNPLTVGLIIHSLADGLALGASSIKGNEGTNLSIVVFMALIIHKCLALGIRQHYLLLTKSIHSTDCLSAVNIFIIHTPSPGRNS